MVIAFLSGPVFADEQKEKALSKKVKEIAGVAEFLRSVPKHYAQLQSVDVEHRRVTLLVEGDKFAKTWELAADAEVKVLGWWGRIDQLPIGGRVWVWFQTDRQKRATGVLMICDEISEQDIHETPWTITKVEKGIATFHPTKGADRSLKLGTIAPIMGERVWFQSSADEIRALLGESEFAKKRDEQKAELRRRWEKNGLPGSVLFLHPLSGELELMLDHEAMRWSRSLQAGAEVEIDAVPPIKAVVREVRPWRERTQVRVVAAAADQGDLKPGQRVHVRTKAPSASVESSLLPPDMGRRKVKEERVEWFLASIYCTCLVRGNICTGHFYTLASCNPNGCGQPTLMKKQIADLIDKGMTDEQVFAALLKEHGPGLLKPHLLP
jgi:hypothetical protein